MALLGRDHGFGHRDSVVSNPKRERGPACQRVTSISSLTRRVIVAETMIKACASFPAPDPEISQSPFLFLYPSWIECHG